MHRSRVFIFICCAFIVGVAFASWLHVGVVVLWMSVSAAGILLLTGRPYTALIGACILAAALGAWRTQSVLDRSSAVWELAAAKPVVSLTGYVDSAFERTANGGRFTFRVVGITSDEQEFRTDDRVLVSGPAWVRPVQGQWLTVTGKLQRAKSYDDFDYVSYLAKDGIHGVMYYPTYGVPSGPVAPPFTRVRVRIVAELSGVRRALTESIARAVPEPESGYLAGILVGAKGNVDADLKEAFARTGTSHIVALSGYNITIIATVLMMLLAPLGRRRSYGLAVTAIALFTVMVGAQASVVRAAIMGILAMTATRMGRLQDAGGAMAATGALMCAFNPALLRWDVGFQLSFLAFAGIVYVQPLLESQVIRFVHWKSLGAIIATTLAAQVLVLPLLLHVFGTLAVYTLPVNILVLPLVPVAMALGFATAVAGLVWPLAGLFVGQSAWLVASLQLGIIRFASSLPYAALEISLSATTTVALYFGLVVWLISLYRGQVKRTTTPHA